MIPEWLIQPDLKHPTSCGRHGTLEFTIRTFAGRTPKGDFEIQMLYLKLLGIMLLARLPLLDALAVLRDMEEDEEMTKAIKKTMSSLAGAAAFYESLDEAFLDPFIRDTVAFATGLGEAIETITNWPYARL